MEHFLNFLLFLFEAIADITTSRQNTNQPHSVRLISSPITWFFLLFIIIAVMDGLMMPLFRFVIPAHLACGGCLLGIMIWRNKPLTWQENIFRPRMIFYFLVWVIVGNTLWSIN